MSRQRTAEVLARYLRERFEVNQRKDTHTIEVVTFRGIVKLNLNDMVQLVLDEEKAPASSYDITGLYRS